jgi:hypothetical protein
MLMRSWISIHHANQYLTNQKITCYNFATNADLFDYKPEFCKMNVCYPDIADIIKQYGSVDGNEGMHPNEESHKHIAHAMLNKVLGGYV